MFSAQAVWDRKLFFSSSSTSLLRYVWYWVRICFHLITCATCRVWRNMYRAMFGFSIIWQSIVFLWRNVWRCKLNNTWETAHAKCIYVEAPYILVKQQCFVKRYSRQLFLNASTAFLRRPPTLKQHTTTSWIMHDFVRLGQLATKYRFCISCAKRA